MEADTGIVYWHVSLLPAGGSTVTSSEVACQDITPQVGITGTPVIDSSTHTIYVLTKAKVNSTYVQYLHALDVISHAEKFGGPVLIKASVAGTGYGSVGGKIRFNAFFEYCRPGVLLSIPATAPARGVGRLLLTVTGCERRNHLSYRSSSDCGKLLRLTSLVPDRAGTSHRAP